MSTNSKLNDIQDWLTDEALGSPDIPKIFEELCGKLIYAGIPLNKAFLTWTTLHPLIEAESVSWSLGASAAVEQYFHEKDEQVGELKVSVSKLLQSGAAPELHENLASPSLDDFLEDDGEEITDDLIFANPFEMPSTPELRSSTGIMINWATCAPDGFSEEHAQMIKAAQKKFALCCRVHIQNRIGLTIAETYLGRWAAARMLAGQIRHGDGETIEAVIFYCDLRGSTPMANQLGLEKYLKQLNLYFKSCAGAVIDNGGEILDFIGDAVLAIFPMESGGMEQAAEQAVASAIQAHAKLKHASVGLPLELRCGVALSVGKVMFGNIGVPSRLAFSVIGQTVHAAARMESLTKTLGSILVTEDIARNVSQETRFAGTHELIGFEEPVNLYTIKAGTR